MFTSLQKMTARKLYSQSAKVVTKQISFSIFFCMKEELNVGLLANGSTVISAYEIAGGGDHLKTEGRVYVAQAIQKTILA